MERVQQFMDGVLSGDKKSIARAISLVENEVDGYLELLGLLPIKQTPVIGITGPPGAGKSSLTDALIEIYIQHHKQVAVLCVDPSSPFNLGAILGDRIRMSDWYNNDKVYIRSLATRGALGGLAPKIMEVTDLLKAGPADVVIIETVGVGQSEIEIAGLADCTIVTMVPEAGDEIQTIKAGIMEIADLFVVNKADRPGAQQFVNSLGEMMSPGISGERKKIPVLKTSALQKDGIAELYDAIQQSLQQNSGNEERKKWLLMEKAYKLIQYYLSQKVSKGKLQEQITQQQPSNIYAFVQAFIEDEGL